MQKKCNVLWILCDQLRWHALSCHGDPNIQTPNIDRLAAEGADFQRAYCPTPVCTPARGNLFTGQYGNVNGLPLLGDLLAPDKRTIAHTFKEAGYRTSYVGKWHMASTQNAIGHNEGTDWWVHPQLRGGFEDWFAFELSNHFWKSAYSTGNKMWPPQTIEGYQTDELVKLSLGYLDKQIKEDQPWFHVLSVEAPHHGMDDQGKTLVTVGDQKHSRHPAPPEYEARFKPEDVTLRKNVPPECEAVAQSKLAQYYAQIANLDDNVGRVLDWLDENGLADSTLVCLTSDHGEMGGSQCRMQKACIYDEATRIPMIMRLPGVIQKKAAPEDLISLVDVFPTTAELCGLSAPEEVQGFSLAKCATGEDVNPVRDTLLFQWFGNMRYLPASKKDIFWRGIRTHHPKWTYCVSSDTRDGQFLFDDEADPYQMNNLFDDPECREIRVELHVKLEAELQRAGEDPLPDFVMNCRPA